MSPSQLDRLHGVHIVLQQRLNLAPARTVLVEFKEFLGLQAVRERVHIGVRHQVVERKYLAVLAEGDVGQLAVPVGVLQDGLLDQLPGDHRGVGSLVVPTVNLEDLGARHRF